MKNLFKIKTKIKKKKVLKKKFKSYKIYFQFVNGFLEV